MCYVTSLFVVLFQIEQLKTVMNLIRSTSTDPITYFRVGEELSKGMYGMTSLITIWFKSDYLVSILDFFQDAKSVYNTTFQHSHTNYKVSAIELKIVQQFSSLILP